MIIVNFAIARNADIGLEFTLLFYIDIQGDNVIVFTLFFYIYCERSRKLLRVISEADAFKGNAIKDEMLNNLDLFKLGNRITADEYSELVKIINDNKNN